MLFICAVTLIPRLFLCWRTDMLDTSDAELDICMRAVTCTGGIRSIEGTAVGSGLANDSNLVKLGILLQVRQP